MAQRLTLISLCMDESKRFRVEVTGRPGSWKTVFWIDEEGFTVVSDTTKARALWFKKNLLHAFSKLDFTDAKPADGE